MLMNFEGMKAVQLPEGVLIVEPRGPFSGMFIGNTAADCESYGLAGFFCTTSRDADYAKSAVAWFNKLPFRLAPAYEGEIDALVDDFFAVVVAPRERPYKRSIFSRERCSLCAGKLSRYQEWRKCESCGNEFQAAKNVEN